MYLVFGLPFFIVNCLKLRQRQKIGLVGIFSLGLITIIISLSRFIVYTATNYTVDDASGSRSPNFASYTSLYPLITSKIFLSSPNLTADAWCTAEMSTAVIVVSLPSLKTLIFRSTPTSTSNRSTSGYMQTGSGKPISHGGGTSRSQIEGGKMDDEMELVFLDRKSSLSLTGRTGGTEAQDVKDAVMVTTNVTIMRGVL